MRCNQILMNMERILRLFHAVLIVTLLIPSLGFAQTDQNQPTPPAPKEEAVTVGPTAFVEVQGSRSSLGIVTNLDTSLGYQLTKHITMDIGLPIFYVRSPFALVTTHDWETNTLLGDPYLDVRYSRTFSGAKVTSILTGTFPASGQNRVFTTGRVGVDLFNHIESKKALMGFKPFLNAGAANQTINRYYFPRPYSLARPFQSLGFIADFEGGLSYRIHHDYNLGASMYALEPGGHQKVFSRLITPGSSVVGDGSFNRLFDSAFETIGTSVIAHDNGYSGWLEITRFRNVNLQFGFTHSVHYRLDTASLAVTFDATTALRELTGQTGK
jgi:hypothetical protein